MSYQIYYFRTKLKKNFPLTASHAFCWVSTARTFLLLDVVATTTASPTEGVRLIVSLTKAGCTLRLQRQSRKDQLISCTNCPLYVYMHCDLLSHCTCTGYIDSIQTMVIFEAIQSGIPYWRQREPRLQSSRNVPPGCLYNICQAGGWVKCLTLVFRGVKFGIKWLICILRASYRACIGKVCKWAWLVALTDGFDFQTFATSAGKFYNFQFFKCIKNENYPHTKLASLLLNNF